MSLSSLSASSLMMLLTIVGLPFAGLSLTQLPSLAGEMFSPFGRPSAATQLPIPQAAGDRTIVQSVGLSDKQSVRITDTVIEIRDNQGDVVQINRQGDRSSPSHPFQPPFPSPSQVPSQRSSPLSQPTDQAYTLTVSSTGRSLNASLKVNGRTVQTLSRLSETIDMTPHLASGQNTFEISGTYAPASASTRITLAGPGTQMIQQVSGGGVLNQTLQVAVR